MAAKFVAFDRIERLASVLNMLIHLSPFPNIDVAIDQDDILGSIESSKEQDKLMERYEIIERKSSNAEKELAELCENSYALSSLWEKAD
ncbi:unnamed protein product [Vicia faba]|uniref:Uncharacterized protein n=1 Tax=Vicia faba TaxID=3906 RepID=A0AAV0Z718_VICFA|nr:unnamed protein product [Vicia faba]